MGWGAAIGGVASLIGSKSASDSASRSAKDARRANEAMMKRLDAIDLPEEEKQRILLENPELVGLLEAEQIEKSKMEEIALDGGLRDNQMQALDSLKERSEEGLTATDRYSMEQMLGQVADQQKSNQAGIEADMARRGMDSSGAALMSKLQNKQSGANSARDKAMQMAAQGQQNRMGALQALGQQSGQMQQQDFNRQARTASAQDAIARANAMNKQQVSGANLAARQGIENQRANISNQQEVHNKGLVQQGFDNQLKKAGAQNVVSGQQANTANALAQNQANASANMINTAAGLGSAYMQYAKEDGGIITAADGGVMSRHSMPIQDQQKDIAREAREKEDKQHESFKKKYMKRVREELTPAGDEARKEVTRAADGGVMKDVTTPSELPERGGSDFASPDDRNSAIMTSLLAQMKNVDPEQNIPLEREDGGPMYASDGTGGIIDSGMESYAGDRVDAKVNDKEIIVNLPQQQRLMDLLRGKISVDELGTDDIVEGVPREFRDDMHEELEEESEESDRMSGIQKLLEMLGK